MKKQRFKILLGCLLLMTIGLSGIDRISSGQLEAAANNLITNQGFEDGTTTEWQSFGECTIAATDEAAYSGSYSCLVSDRTESWQGIAFDLSSIVEHGVTYNVSCWVRLANTASASVTMTVKKVNEAGDEDYVNLAQQTVTDSEWVKLSGSLTASITEPLTEYVFYIEGPDAEVNFYIDEASLTVFDETEWLEEANARIEEIRKRNAEVTVVDTEGNPVSDATIQVSQKKHYFGFGSAMSSEILNNQQYQDFFKANYEWAVHENEVKWYSTESSQGNENYYNADAMYEFCEENNIKVRGHCIFWAVDQYVQSWVQNLSDTDLAAAVDNRLESVVTRYKGKFLHWDVNNEMLHGQFFQDRLGASIRPYMYQQAHELDPDALLFVNDYNVVTSTATDDYVQQITELMDAGAPIHGIGAQCHFTDIDPETIYERFDKLAAFNLPIWCTEFDVLDSDVSLRADKLEKFYRTAFSHPAVEGILMWGFWASEHWRGEDAAIVNADWTVNEAGLRYQALMQEWTTNETGTVTDGSYDFRGFYGSYQITVTKDGQTSVATVDLEPIKPGEEDTAKLQVVFDPGTTPTQYQLTVVDGSGTGLYEEGEEVAISWIAQEPEPGERIVFTGWTGDIEYLADPTKSNTTVTMPAENIEVQANYIFEEISEEITVSLTMNEWNTGATVNITINNETESAIDGWELSLSLPSGQTIDQSWSSSFEQTGSDVTFSNAAWNSYIAPGANTSFGFNLTHSGENEMPTECTVNGIVIPITIE